MKRHIDAANRKLSVKAFLIGCIAAMILLYGCMTAEQDTVDTVPKDVTDSLSIEAPQTAASKNMIPEEKIADIYIPESGLVNPPVVVQWVTASMPDTDKALPAIAVMEIDAQLNILAKDGTPISVVGDFYGTYGRSVIPAFLVDGIEETEVIVQFLKENELIDVYVLGREQDIELVTRAHKLWKYCRGGLIYETLGSSAEQWAEICAEANNDAAVTQLISESPLSVEAMAYFNSHAVAAWGCARDAADVYRAISSGYHAVVTEDPSLVYEVYKSISVPTISGRPIPIAHRGAHLNYGKETDDGDNGYPENSIESFKLAAEKYGCLGVEVDLRLSSKDSKGERAIVLDHDGDLSRTTNIEEMEVSMPDVFKKGTSTSNYSIEELKLLDLDTHGEEKQIKMCSLEEALAATEELGLVYYCHVNQTHTQDLFNRLLTENPEYVDNCVVFIGASQVQSTFNQSVLSPTVPITLGQSDPIDAILQQDDCAEVMEDLIRLLNPYSSHPLFYDYGNHMTEDFYYRMAARGFLSIHSITRGQETLNERFLTTQGCVSALIDQVHLADDWHYFIDAGKEDQELWVGEKLNLRHTLLRIAGETEIDCSFIQLSGPLLTWNEDVKGYTAGQTGRAEVVFYAELSTEANVEYRVYSAPVSIKIANAG